MLDDDGNSVIINALSVTENGTYTAPTGYAYSPVTVNIPTTSSTNFVHGEFTSLAGTGVFDFLIPYEGSGYPIMAYIVVKGGAYVSGTEWYTAVQQNAVGMWAMSKSDMSLTPTYKTSGTENQAVVCVIYKSSTSSATSYSRTSAMNVNTFSSSAANNSSLTCVRFTGNKRLSYYTNKSGYGLFPNTKYEYFIVYSE